jgi:hypothetical protein
MLNLQAATSSTATLILVERHAITTTLANALTNAGVRGVLATSSDARRFFVNVLRIV